jgi:hypothetical protein
MMYTNWLPAFDIAKLFIDTSEARVMFTIRGLGLHTNRAHSVLPEFDGEPDETLRRYSPAAVALVVRELRSRGHKLADNVNSSANQVAS